MNTAQCPSCHGAGKIGTVYSRRDHAMHEVKCLSCLGTGEVEAYRVCCDCGKWRAACICRNHTVETIVVRAASKRKQHTLAVSQRKSDGYWVVRREGWREVARFEDEDSAYSFAREAEWANETEWPELREKWGAKGKVKAQ